MSGGGIAINAGIQAAEIFGIAAIKVYEKTNVPSLTPGATQPWRPPQWAAATDPTKMLYCITVPASYATILGPSTATSSVPNGQPLSDGTLRVTVSAPVVQGAQTSPATYLVFDGVKHASHSQPARPTQFPVQTQANITDHVILQPAHLSLDIVMSDAQQAFAVGQWVGAASKSISCFLVLDALRAARVPLTVSTRLKTYQNMVILDIIPDESVQTLYGLRARVEFQQILTASVSIAQGTSVRQQTTDSTENGPTNTQGVPAGVAAQNGIPATSGPVTSTSGQKFPAQTPISTVLQSQTGTVVGAGNWSSNNVAPDQAFFQSGFGGNSGGGGASGKW